MQYIVYWAPHKVQAWWSQPPSIRPEPTNLRAEPTTLRCQQ